MKRRVQVGGEGWLSQEELENLPDGTNIEVRWPGIDPKSSTDILICVLGRKGGKPCAFKDGVFVGYLTFVGYQKKLHTRVRPVALT